MKLFGIPIFVLSLGIAPVSAVYHLDHVRGPRSIVDPTEDFHVKRICGTVISAERKALAEKLFSANRVISSSRNLTNAGPAIINLHFHVIAANTTVEGGHLLQSQVDAQVDVLNRDFKRSGLQFRLVNTSRVMNEDWFYNVSPYGGEVTYMKEELRQGGVETLNVYTVSFNNYYSDGLLGFATFPSDYQEEPKNDGIVIQFGTLPDGYLEPYNLGRTLTHEVGHWVGLYHTFEGGCDPESGGDEVTDTPAQLTPTSGCPKVKPDTCPDQPGRDPIHNFMDYSDDICLTKFSKGQIVRLRDQLRTYRGIDV